MDKPIFGNWKPNYLIILILASLSTTGTNYINDMLNVLQPVITAPTGCRNISESNKYTVCCYDCLGIGDSKYNLLHTVLFWTCALSLIVSGYLLDKLGNWILILLVSLTLFGAVIIAIGASLNSTPAVQPLLFIGTFFRGLGLLTSLVARSKILSGWFLDKEIGFAFGAASAINRVGSIPSYMLTEYIRELYGLSATLWIGVTVTAFSVLCAIMVVFLDSGIFRVRFQELHADSRRSSSIKNVARFPAEYWVLVALIGFYSGVFRPMQANGTEMIHEKFGLKKTHAAIVAGEMLYTSVVLSPLIGMMLDKAGRRCYVILMASLLHIPALTLLGFSNVTPVIGCFIMGVAFCCFTSVLMSSISLLVDRNSFGLAISLAQLSGTLCSGAVHAVLAEIFRGKSFASQQETHHLWQQGVTFLMMLATIAACLAAVLLVMSVRSSGVLARKPGSQTLKIDDGVALK